MCKTELPFRTVPEGVLKAHKDRMGEIDVRVRRLADIQMIDGVDLMAMILEIEHYRSKPEPSNDLTKRLYGIAREYEEHNICTPGDEDRMVAAMREAADRLAFLERERAEQPKDAVAEIERIQRESLRQPRDVAQEPEKRVPRHTPGIPTSGGSEGAATAAHPFNDSHIQQIVRDYEMGVHTGSVRMEPNEKAVDSMRNALRNAEQSEGAPQREGWTIDVPNAIEVAVGIQAEEIRRLRAMIEKVAQTAQEAVAYVDDQENTEYERGMNDAGKSVLFDLKGTETPSETQHR